MKADKSDRTLMIIAYIATIIFLMVVLCPLILITSYSLKDSTAIYEYPPSLMPKSANSVTIVLDYSEYSDVGEEELLHMILKDSMLAMYATYADMNKSSIFEIKTFGVMNGKNIFYQRAHGTHLRLELDYGRLSGSSILQKSTMEYKDKYLKLVERIPYTFNLSGIKKGYNHEILGKNNINDEIIRLLTDEQKDRQMYGKILGTTLTSNSLLFFETYKYYFLAPAYMFSDVTIIAKHSFAVFVFNTLLIMAWAILTQVGICSLTAFSLSRLFNRKTSNILMLYFLITLMIPFTCILIPQLILIQNLGMMNTYGAMLLPYLYPAAMYTFLFRGLFDKLPQSLFDAAHIDGASQWYSYWNICLPLSKPIISVVMLNVVVSAWGDYFWYSIAANRPHLWTINLALYAISSAQKTKVNVSMGLSLISILPVIALTMIFSEKIKSTIVQVELKG